MDPHRRLREQYQPRTEIVASLISKRLRIEPLRSEHAELVLSCLQDPAIYTYLPGDPPAPQVLQKRYDFWAKGRSPDGEELWLNWVAFLGDSMLPIGTFQATLPKQGSGLFAYTVFPPYWRQGYAKEMALCVIDHLFEAHEPPVLRAEIDNRNIGSIRLVESLGLARVALTRNADFFKGAPSDEFTYAISREDWRQLRL
jgi:ribosomal-protein-alanine N-acetyltransferase